MALYLARYLNVPPASLPGESSEGLYDLPVSAEEIRTALLDTFDRQQQIGAAARLVARHLTLGHSPDALIATLAQALLREDAGPLGARETLVNRFHRRGASFTHSTRLPSSIFQNWDGMRQRRSRDL